MKTTILLLAYTCDIVSKTNTNPYVVAGKSDGVMSMQLDYSKPQEYVDEYMKGVQDLRTQILSQVTDDLTIAYLQINCLHSYTVSI